jgi:hypothetical protein
MSAIEQRGFTELQKALNEIADNWDSKVSAELFDYVGRAAVQEMQGLAPVDTGTLKAGIKFVKATNNTAQIVCEADYSAAVDQGHRTRGSTFVPANPFFSSVIGRLAGGDLIKQARVKMQDHIEATLSHYRTR